MELIERNNKKNTNEIEDSDGNEKKKRNIISDSENRIFACFIIVFRFGSHRCLDYYYYYTNRSLK